MRLRLIIFMLLLAALGGCKERANTRRGFDQEKMAYYNASETYNYDKTIVVSDNPVLSFFARAISLVALFFNTVLGYILLAGLIALLIWILFRYVNQDRVSYTDAPDVMRVIDEKNVEQVDFAKLIAQALDKGDYRLAIRFSFLNLLKTLSRQELIKVKEGKTNFEYYYELPADLRPVYRQALAIFEYVWYGEFMATAATYQQISDRVQELQSLTGGRNHA